MKCIKILKKFIKHSHIFFGILMNPSSTLLIMSPTPCVNDAGLLLCNRILLR